VTEIVNLKGELVSSSSGRLKHAPTLDDWAQQIAELIDAAIIAGPLARSEIHRVGVALTALVDSASGVMHWLATYPVRPTPVAAILEKRLGLPVVVDNNTNVIARAEHWFGAAQHDDFSIVALGLGVGLARFTDGSLWTGTHGLNPEFGHVKVSFNGGRACVCGAHGCLTMYAGMYGMVDQVCERRGIELPTLLKIVAAFHEFAADARSGKPDVREVFELAGAMLGTAVANHINENDPGRVIMLAFDPLLSEAIGGSFEQALQANVMHVLKARTAIEWRVADESDFRKGAAALVLERIYQLPDSRLPRSVSTRSSRRTPERTHARER
jgi:predicted NBD/HSP70 family sugar kinase